jgi:glycosyltransferase involved in cell wall biosynthesis
MNDEPMISVERKPARSSAPTGACMTSPTPRIVLLAEAAGGVTRHVIDLYKGLRSRDWRVSMVLSPMRLEDRYRDELDQLDPDDITYVSMRRAPHVTDLSAYFEIAGLLKSDPRETILHAHSTKAGMIGSLLHSRVQASLFTPHAYRGEDPSASGLSKSFFGRVEHNFSRHYDRILAVAPGEMEYAKSIGLRPEVLRCIPNGLDTGHVRFSEVWERRRLLHRPLCLGFVGRLVYQKNPALFLQVLAKIADHVPDVRAIIVGDGPMRVKLLRLASRLGVEQRIEWHGDVPATEFLPEMDVMVHTSIYEGLPYSLIEACADLLPTVATSNYGSEAVFRERLPHNIASSPDAEEMASILLSIVANDSLRMEQMGALAEIAQQYSVDTMVTNIEAEYYALVSA